VSFAEAFLINGLAHLVGTYWPVDDTAAEIFAKVFYGELAQATTVGQALLSARQALQAKSLFDWANYIHYGEPNFSIKKPG
jgi:CHAT domain-containing protein